MSEVAETKTNAIMSSASKNDTAIKQRWMRLYPYREATNAIVGAKKYKLPAEKSTPGIPVIRQTAKTHAIAMASASRCRIRNWSASGFNRAFQSGNGRNHAGRASDLQADQKPRLPSSRAFHGSPLLHPPKIQSEQARAIAAEKSSELCVCIVIDDSSTLG